MRDRLTMFDHEPIETGGDGHIRNPCWQSSRYAKSMWSAARLKEKGARLCLPSFRTPKNIKGTFQYLERYILGIVDVERRFISSCEHNIEQVENTSCLFCACHNADQRLQGREPLISNQHVVGGGLE